MFEDTFANRSVAGAAMDKQEVAKHLQSVVDLAPVGLWAVDTNGVFTL